MVAFRRSASDLSTWTFNRFVMTGPTRCLLVTGFGVGLRHQFAGQSGFCLYPGMMLAFPSSKLLWMATSGGLVAS